MTTIAIPQTLKYVDPDEMIVIPSDAAIAVIRTLGGPELSTNYAEERIAKAFHEVAVKVPSTSAEIDIELEKPCSVQRRVQLMWKRTELDQAERSVSAYRPVGDVVVNAPDGLTTVIFRNRTVLCEVIDGRKAFRLFLSEFLHLADNDPRWSIANPELVGR